MSTLFFQVNKDKIPAGAGDNITSLPISIPLSTVHPSKLPVSIPLASVVLPNRAERLVCVFACVCMWVINSKHNKFLPYD